MKRPTQLGELLTSTRGDRSISAMADLLGVNKNTLGSYERGHSQPDVEFLLRFSNVTGASLAALIELRLCAAGARLAPADPASEHLRTAVDRLEAARGEPQGTLDEDPLQTAIAAVEEHLAERRKTLVPEKKAAVIAHLYSRAAQPAPGERKFIDPGAVRSAVHLALPVEPAGRP